MVTKQRHEVHDSSDSEAGHSGRLYQVWTSETESAAHTDASDYTDSDAESGSDNESAALDPEERSQIMGHHGSTYEEFYMPDLIERDFQAIYFGTPSQDDLIWSVLRMGLSRDMRAPYSLTPEQKEEVYNHPDSDTL